MMTNLKRRSETNAYFFQRSGKVNRSDGVVDCVRLRTCRYRLSNVGSGRARIPML